MNTRHLCATLLQLGRDTFRQAWSSGIAAMMYGVTAICVVLCLSVHVSGDASLHGSDQPPLFMRQPTAQEIAPSVIAVLSSADTLQTLSLTTASSKIVWLSPLYNPELARREGIDTITGRMSLAFGAVSFPVPRERADAVRFLELVLSWGIAGFLGLLLALVWTAGFLPTFLEPSAASVLLAKPVGRWQLLLGKYIGVLTFVGYQVVLFVVLTWLALGLSTNVWDLTFWWCIPLLLLQFATLYSFSVLLAVTTRSTVTCVFGSLLFWLLALGINYGSVMARQETQHLSAVTRTLSQAAYWISPKPIDAGLILFNALEAKPHFDKPWVFKVLESENSFSPQLSILSSLALAIVLLALSAYEFSTKDY